MLVCKYCGALDIDETDRVCPDCRDDGADEQLPPKRIRDREGRLQARPDDWPETCAHCGRKFKRDETDDKVVCIVCAMDLPGWKVKAYETPDDEPVDSAEDSLADMIKTLEAEFDVPAIKRTLSVLLTSHPRYFLRQVPTLPADLSAKYADVFE